MLGQESRCGGELKGEPTLTAAAAGVLSQRCMSQRQDIATPAGAEGWRGDDKTQYSRSYG